MINMQTHTTNFNKQVKSIEVQIAFRSVLFYGLQMQTGVRHLLEATATLAILPLWPPQR